MLMWRNELSYEQEPGNWRDGSVVQNCGCLCKGARCRSQRLLGSSHLFITPAPGDPTSSSGLHGHRHPCDVIYTRTQLKIKYFLKARNPPNRLLWSCQNQLSGGTVKVGRIKQDALWSSLVIIMYAHVRFTWHLYVLCKTHRMLGRH